MFKPWQDLLFFTALALLFSHEIDAVPNAEWRVLPGMHLLPGEQGGIGYIAFVLLHIPLFGLLMHWAGHLDPVVRRRGQFWISVFMVAHTIVHLAYQASGHPDYLFSGWFSNGLIVGAGVLAAVHLVLTRRASQPTDPG